MINKFRYKKPPQVLNGSSDDTDLKCMENKDNTLTRKDKSGAKQDAGVFSNGLDNEEKRKLIELFKELQYSTAKVLSPDGVRKALADAFSDQHKFELGSMDDAAECYEKILMKIHHHITDNGPEDTCNVQKCIPHQIFAQNILEQLVCNHCGITRDPMIFTQLIQYVNTNTLIYQKKTSPGRRDTFGKLLQKANSMGEDRLCPAPCGSNTKRCRTLMNEPEVISIGLVWDSDNASWADLSDVFSCIDTKLHVSDVFHDVTHTDWAEECIHKLVGVIAYCYRHYATFFLHSKLNEWIYFNDANVKPVGSDWQQVVEMCTENNFQPLLLIYAKENVTQNVSFSFNAEKKPPIPLTNQQMLRRSVTPSPEKPNVSSTRRAITPNPENSPLNQKPHFPRLYNEYQNLSVIQKSIKDLSVRDQVGGCTIQKPPEYKIRRPLEGGQHQVNVHRTLSNGSSSGVESGVSVPDHLNIPRRRDSGNWSGDRNSASSASSTTMENPYLYLVGKMPPGSPTRTKADLLNGAYDAGYDSYSLSSNDSTNVTTLQHMMKTGHLAQIPEDYSSVASMQNSQSCDVLCDEADELLVKSRQLEDAHDLVLALALCNAAATKARAAMNAPYNNPQTLTLARMKHNTCIMRARSLHRRMTQVQNPNKENSLEIRHTREGSSGSGRHSRQNSRDKGQHSRQNSKELLMQQEKEKVKPTKNIEIYATLPKKKDALKAKMNAINFEDDEYMFYTAAPERESRSIFSKSKSKELKVKEKRSRSEDRNKISRADLSIAPEIVVAKDTLKKTKETKEKDKDGKNKKQHKIRRKLLMGGLIRRKNRSMPDLTDSNAEESQTCAVDDGKVGIKGNSEINQGMNGYLSEGHLEFSGNSANPNLERSKLMRKSFHGSAGKILTAAKVPPPPPLRTTSQLSRSKSNVSEVVERDGDRCQFNIYGDVNIYHNLAPFNKEQSMSLPYYGNSNSSYDDDSFPSSHTVVTQALVHQSPESPTRHMDSGVDEVDCLPSHSAPMLELPPYPSPGGSAIHSRQASEDFPPPPPPVDLSALDEHLQQNQASIQTKVVEENSLLAQLQQKRNQILTQDDDAKISKLPLSTTVQSSGDTWLKELQAKQAALRIKKHDCLENKENGLDEVNTQRFLHGESKVKSVKDLASKFENSEAMNLNFKPSTAKLIQDVPKSVPVNAPIKSEFSTIAPEQIAEEIREVEMITSAVNKVFGHHQEKTEEPLSSRPQKKKSVSFCDQVILVATAEEQEDDTYIPNPILERVLRSAVNSSETIAVKQELMSLREQIRHNATQQNPIIDSRVTNSVPVPVNMPQVINNPDQALYVRRNSMENILNQSNHSPRPQPNNPMYNGEMCVPNPISSSQQHHSPMHQQNVSLPQVRRDEQYYTYNSNEPIPQNPQYMRSMNDCGFQQQQSTSEYYGQYNQYVPPKQNNQYIGPQHPKQSMYGYHQPPYRQNSPSHPIENSSPQHYGFAQQGDARQSPYQPIPQNSPSHPGFYGNNRQIPRNVHQNTYGYSTSSRPPYNQPNIRQSTPSPLGYHPPSPVPSVSSSCNNYHPAMYKGSPNTSNSVYQRVPPPSSEYLHNYDSQQFQRSPEVCQQIPPHEEPMYPSNTQYSPYQPVPSSKLPLKKSVSFEPGTKGCESPIPTPIVTPIVVNNANNSIPTDKTKCSLCRKKNVVALNVYCKDCEFYMSRFKPKS